MRAAFLLLLLCVAEADDIRYEMDAKFEKMNSSLELRLSSLERRLSSLEGHNAGTMHTSPSAELVRGQCGIGWSGYSGRCYKYVPFKLTWGTAEDICQSQGAHLASIHSKEEHDFIQTLIGNFDPSQGNTWIGLNDLYVEDRWMWSDGSKVNYTVWASGEPNGGTGENCVHTYKGNQMNDYICANTYPSVCVLRTETRPC